MQVIKRIHTYIQYNRIHDQFDKSLNYLSFSVSYSIHPPPTHNLLLRYNLINGYNINPITCSYFSAVVFIRATLWKNKQCASMHVKTNGKNLILQIQFNQNNLQHLPFKSTLKSTQELRKVTECLSNIYNTRTSSLN